MPHAIVPDVQEADDGPAPSIAWFKRPERFRDALLLSSRRLEQREPRDAHCASPWQTVPVFVNGDVTIGDCLPRHRAGNLLRTPFGEIWNGPILVGHRRAMRGDDPPAACRSCPRF